MSHLSRIRLGYMPLQLHLTSQLCIHREKKNGAFTLTANPKHSFSQCSPSVTECQSIEHQNDGFCYLTKRGVRRNHPWHRGSKIWPGADAGGSTTIIHVFVYTPRNMHTLVYYSVPRERRETGHTSDRTNKRAKHKENSANMEYIYHTPADVHQVFLR